ncbi:uncharacterized protein EDB93DRAFT_1175452 [Suillus bovinus]|uniref:uncharacterized protein n=1 Tax=Suillus bovinus TaxID=48563 RepID=UPI001B87406C|nr:uncharacterized protein EDB93DRAFT_1175452 [Suillus bovinus]KAG2132931.1 hypothetical protein EDB93DRAFT_1175452 [Suillus bovinus]
MHSFVMLRLCLNCFIFPFILSPGPLMYGFQFYQDASKDEERWAFSLLYLYHLDGRESYNVSFLASESVESNQHLSPSLLLGHRSDSTLVDSATNYIQ